MMYSNIANKESAIFDPKLVIMDYFYTISRRINILTEVSLQNEDFLREHIQISFERNNSRGQKQGESLAEGRTNSFDKLNIVSLVENGTWTEVNMFLTWMSFCQKYDYERKLDKHENQDENEEEERATKRLGISKQDYIIQTRDRLVEFLKQLEKDALEHYEMNKAAKFLNSGRPASLDELMRRLFTRKFIFIYVESNDEEPLKNRRSTDPLGFHLVVLDFYLNEKIRALLQDFLKNNVHFFASKENNSSTFKHQNVYTFNEDYLMAVLLENYLVNLFKRDEPVEPVVYIYEEELLSMEFIRTCESRVWSSHRTRDVVSIDLGEKVNETRTARNFRRSLKNRRPDFSKIKCLDISNVYGENMGKRADVQSLSCLSGLKLLELRFVTFGKNSFVNLFNLRQLNLVNCDFKEMPSEAFLYLVNLEIFCNVGGENCDHLSYSHLGKLKWLQLQSVEMNERSIANLSERLLVLQLSATTGKPSMREILASAKHSKLRALKLSKIHDFKEFNGSVLSGFTSLESLELSCCSIQKINFSLNSTNRLPKLKSLRISNNKLISIDSGVFSGLKWLEKLKIVESQVSEVSREAFRGLDSLRELHLDRNQITSLDRDCFIHTPRLNLLDLSDNHLNLQPNMFSRLGSSLRQLVLNNNKLVSLGSQIFGSLVNLKILVLRSNCISDIHENSFVGLGNLLELDLLDNPLNGDVKSNAFNPFKRIQHVTFSASLRQNHQELFESLADVVPIIILKP